MPTPVYEYGRADGTTWPIPGETEWQLRYGPSLRTTRLHAASIVQAYAVLVDPTISQAEAIRCLKRARQAVGHSEGSSSTTTQEAHGV